MWETDITFEYVSFNSSWIQQGTAVPQWAFQLPSSNDDQRVVVSSCPISKADILLSIGTMKHGRGK